MAEIEAFRGWRYNLARVGALAGVIAPPYDVIDESLSDRLHAQSEHNVVRLTLGRIQATDTDADNRYTRAARLVKDWCRDGILVQEPVPSIYVYSQTFDWEGQRFTRRGFMARVRLEKFGEGRIYPHEETMPGPKADRLRLFHATGMNLSQIFALYPDDENSVSAMLEQAVRGQPPLEATDHLGVLHQLWVVSNPETVSRLRTALGPKPVFIADGHHRYETSVTHREERRAAGKLTGPDDPANFTLMMFVGMSEPGLQVMPTHRLVSGVGDVTIERASQLLAEYFDVEPVGSGESAGEETWNRVQASGRQDVLGLGTTRDRQWVLATLRSPGLMDAAVAQHSAVWKSLGVSILHKLTLDRCLAQAGQPVCRYVHLVSEVAQAIRRRECQVACLVQPAGVEHIRALAGTLEKMPSKSTYFYPKLASGLVFNPIH